MNRRIKELIERATLIYPEFYGTNRREFDKEKFAELIVAECVNNLEIHSTCFDGDVGRGIKTAARLTKEHFGVEL